MALSTRLLTLRRSPILLRLPPYLSALCIAIGIAWLFLLPLNEYSRQTYISENAILAGQVHTYFEGSEHNIFRAYRQEVFALSQRQDSDRLAGLVSVLEEMGLKAATQTYSFEAAGEEMAGTNVYALLQGPRADATEAMVMIAAWRNFEGELNWSGVALALTMARYFKRWSIWSKDIIVLIPEDSTYGPEAWVSAYHSTATTATAARNVSALSIKAGALQGAIALDYPVGPWGKRFDKLDIVYDGINGALPNLDLMNTIVTIAGSHGVGCSLHGITAHSDSYLDRVQCVAKGVLTQAAGCATGPHSAFMPYHVDAITLKTLGDGWHDEMTFGRLTESMFRSINNLLEHFHQSFFFYILMNTHRFVSIGSYLPAAMLVAGSFTVNALALWILSSRGPVESPGQSTSATAAPSSDSKLVAVKEGEHVAFIAEAELKTIERNTFAPVVVVFAVHLISFVPLYMLTQLHRSILLSAFFTLTAATLIMPIVLSILLVTVFRTSAQQLQVMQSLSLLFIGATLSTWATINFSLALVVGLLASPLSFIRPLPLKALFSTPNKSTIQKSSSPLLSVLSLLAVLGYTVFSPPVVTVFLTWFWKRDLSWLLLEVSKAWNAQGAWSGVLVWNVWWPAWVLGGAVLFSEAVS